MCHSHLFPDPPSSSGSSPSSPSPFPSSYQPLWQVKTPMPSRRPSPAWSSGTSDPPTSAAGSRPSSESPGIPPPTGWEERTAGVWKTVNGGVTFEGQWQDAEAFSVGSLTVAPSDRNVIWLGSGEGDPRNSISYGLGVWRSTDGGDSWTHLGLDKTEHIKRIVVDPRDPDVALVCAMGRAWGPNEERGVFRTEDGGQSWTHVLFIDEDTGCADLDLDLSNPRNVYAGMWTFRRRPWRFDDGGKETALYVSRDGGDSWKKIETLPDEPMARPGLSVAQSSPNVVYLITEFPTAGTLFRSDDYGESWRMVNDDRNLNFRPFYYSDVFADPSDPNTVYTLAGGLSKSTDGGRTFQRIASGVHGDHQAIWIDPADGDHVLSGSDGGFQVSFDGGINFHIWRNVDFSQFYHVFVDDQDPYWVCGGLQDNGNWCGPSMTRGGSILADEWFTVSGGDGFYAVPVPGQPWLVYSNAQGGYFRITDTRSGQTRSIEPHPWMVGSQGQNMGQARYRFNWDAPIHISPHDPSVVYWGGNVLFRSRDYGYSWDVISPDLTTDDPEKQLDSGGEIYNDNTAAEFHTTIYTIAESPVEAGVIWVGTDDGNVQVTRDDGASWTNVRDNVPGLPAEAWIQNIEASPTEAGTAFVVVGQPPDGRLHPPRLGDHRLRPELAGPLGGAPPGRLRQGDPTAPRQPQPSLPRDGPGPLRLPGPGPHLGGHPEQPPPGLGPGHQDPAPVQRPGHRNPRGRSVDPGQRPAPGGAGRRHAGRRLPLRHSGGHRLGILEPGLEPGPEHLRGGEPPGGSLHRLLPGGGSRPWVGGRDHPHHRCQADEWSVSCPTSRRRPGSTGPSGT